MWYRNLAILFLTLLIIIGSPSVTIAKESADSVQLYGHIMTDLGYDFDQSNPDWFDVVRPTQLPAYPNQFGTDGNLFFSVRQTRLGLKTFTSTPQGAVRGRFEIDLFGIGANVGETAFHLRHAFVEWKRWGFGQTWSPIIDVDAAPNTLEYWGPVGMVLYRNIQLRYTLVDHPQDLLQVANERPGASADEGNFTSRIELAGVKPKFACPDISASYKHSFSAGYLRLAGIFRQIGWKNLSPGYYDLNGRANCWGFNLSTRFQMTNKDVMKAQVIYGQGIESCMNDGTYDIGVRVIGDSLSVRPIEGYALPVSGYYIALEHTWSPKLQSTLMYSSSTVRNAPAVAPSTFRQGHYALINLIYSPFDGLLFGAELQWAQRINEAAMDGFRQVQQRRIQFSLKYSFNYMMRTPRNNPER